MEKYQNPPQQDNISRFEETLNQFIQVTMETRNA